MPCGYFLLCVFRADAVAQGLVGTQGALSMVCLVVFLQRYKEGTGQSQLDSHMTSQRRPYDPGPDKE